MLHTYTHTRTLQNDAALLFLGPRLGAQDGADRLIKHSLQSLLRQRRTFEVLDSTDLLGHRQALWVGDGRESLVSKLLIRLFVFAQIELGAHQDDGRVGTVMADLGEPLSTHSVLHTFRQTRKL